MSIRRHGHARWAAAVLLLPLAAVGCRGIRNQPQAFDGATLMRTMNPFILTSLVSRRLTVEIDWFEGRPPSPDAVEAIERVLEEHCDDDKQIRVVLDDEIPLAEWSAAAGRQGLEDLVSRHLDRDPTAWTDEELVYVLYAPESEPWYGRDVSGMSDTIVFESGSTVRVVRGVLVFSERIRRDAMLWITAPRIETATVVHELGHALGLVSNPRHMQRDHDAHCSRPRCVMAQPDARTMVYNAAPAFFAADIPDEYCELCRGDIEAAKRMWSAMDREHPGFAASLRGERVRREARLVEEWRSTPSGR